VGEGTIFVGARALLSPLAGGENGPRPATKKREMKSWAKNGAILTATNGDNPQFLAVFHAYYHLYDADNPEQFLSGS
jgi:hypothetical protein